MAGNDTTEDGAAGKYEQSTEEYVSVLLFEIVITCAVVLTNTVVICSILFVRKLRDNVSNIFILNLSIADFCCGVWPLPFLVATQVSRGWDFGHFLCSVNITFNIGLSSTSAYGVMLVSLDKYIYLIHPLHYHQLVTKTRARLAVVATWVAAFLFSGAGCLTRWNESGGTWRNVYPPTCYPIKTEFVISTAVFYVIIPGIVITYCGFHILRAIRNQLKKIEPRNLGGASPREEESVAATAVARGFGAGGGRGIYVEDMEMPQKSAREAATASNKTSAEGAEREGGERTVARKPVNSQSGTSLATLTIANARTRRRPLIKLTNGMRQLSKSEIKAIKAIGLVIMAFFVMWTPFFLTLAVAGLYTNDKVNFRRALAVTVCVGYSNSAINPLLYAKNRDFRQAYKRILCCSLQKYNEFTGSHISRSFAETSKPSPNTVYRRKRRRRHLRC